MIWWRLTSTSAAHGDQGLTELLIETLLVVIDTDADIQASLCTTFTSIFNTFKVIHPFESIIERCKTRMNLLPIPTWD